MGEPITRESYRAALQKAVDLKGSEYVYWKPDGASGCQYMEGKNPSCLHAHALFSLGYTDLSQYERMSIKAIFDELDVEDDELIRAAARSQYEQDNGRTWGQALETFDSQLNDPIDPVSW